MSVESGSEEEGVVAHSREIDDHTNELEGTQLLSDEIRREFLTLTATTLARSRLDELQELKAVIDQLGSMLSRLHEVRAVIDGATALHAAMDTKVSREIEEATRLPTCPATSPGAGSFSDRFAHHLEMLMM